MPKTKRNMSQGSRTNTRLLAGTQSGLIRARVTGSGAVGVKSNNIGGAMGAIATSTTALRSTCTAVKINRVRLIIPPPSSGSVNSGRLTWFGGDEHETQSSLIGSTNNPAKCAVIAARPPRESSAAFWTDGNNITLFNIHAPVGTIVELEIMIRHSRPGQPGFTPDVTVAGLTVGDTYYAALATTLLTIDDGN